MLRELIRARERQERHHLLQPQARRRDPAQVAAEAWLQCRRPARRHGPEQPHGDAGCFPRRPHLRCWRRATWPRAASTSPTSATSSTSTCPGRPTTTCTASAARAAPARKARSLTLVTPNDIKQLNDIEKMLGVDVTWIGEPPSAEDMASSVRRRGRGRRGGRPAGAAATRDAAAGRCATERARPDREPSRDGSGGQPAQPPGRRRRAGSRRRHQGRETTEAGTCGAASVEKPGRRTHATAREREASGRERTGRSARPISSRSDGRSKAATSRQAAREPWEPREPRRQPDRDDRRPTPVGLGDHVPAFLRKTTRRRRTEAERCRPMHAVLASAAGRRKLTANGELLARILASSGGGRGATDHRHDTAIMRPRSGARWIRSSRR